MVRAVFCIISEGATQRAEGSPVTVVKCLKRAPPRREVQV